MATKILSAYNVYTGWISIKYHYLTACFPRITEYLELIKANDNVVSNEL